MFFFFQAEDGIRALVRSRGLGDVYKRQQQEISAEIFQSKVGREIDVLVDAIDLENEEAVALSLIHI